MAHVYTACVRVRHHEVDPFGRVTPATYLRLLAQAAIEASTDAGFDARWYAQVGGHWLVRRTTWTIMRHVRADTDLEVRTWVEDFRRVLSARRYDVHTLAGDPVLDAVTDWVYVDGGTGKVRRIPREIEQGLGVRPPGAAPRPGFRLPPPPVQPARTRSRVQWAQLDALAHVNNAAYLDVLVQSVLDVLAERGWPVTRLVGDGTLPGVHGGDIEYLDAAVYGDELETVTWFTPAAHGLDAHQRLERLSDGRRIVEATTAWRWAAAVANQPAPVPAGLPDAVRPLMAA